MVSVIDSNTLSSWPSRARRDTIIPAVFNKLAHHVHVRVCVRGWAGNRERDRASSFIVVLAFMQAAVIRAVVVWPGLQVLCLLPSCGTGCVSLPFFLSACLTAAHPEVDIEGLIKSLSRSLSLVPASSCTPQAHPHRITAKRLHPATPRSTCTCAARELAAVESKACAYVTLVSASS